MTTSPLHAAPARRRQSAGAGWRSLLAGCLAVISLPLLAAPATTSWLCWYDDGEAILCQLWATDPVEATAAAARLSADKSLPAGAPSLDDRLPAMARTIWDRPAETFGKRIRIPLFTIPEDIGFVRELADAVMCGAKAACQVRFLESRGALALLLDELEDAT